MDKLNEEEKETVNCTFDAALEFLSLFDDDRGAVVPAESDVIPKSDVSTKLQKPPAIATKRRVQQIAKEQVVPASKKRKLERIKAPVVVLRKKKISRGPSEEEQEKSVRKTLAYLVQLPQQEIYQPPPAPLVTVNIDFEVNRVQVQLQILLNLTMTTEFVNLLVYRSMNTSPVRKTLHCGSSSDHLPLIAMCLWET